MTARPRNVVLAQAVQVDADQLRALVERVGATLGSPKLARTLRRPWGNLRYIGELGGLISRCRKACPACSMPWVEEQAKAKGLTRLTDRRGEGQAKLGAIVDEVVSAQSGQLQLQRAVLEDEAARVRANCSPVSTASLVRSPTIPQQLWPRAPPSPPPSGAVVVALRCDRHESALRLVHQARKR